MTGRERAACARRLGVHPDLVSMGPGGVVYVHHAPDVDRHRVRFELWHHARERITLPRHVPTGSVHPVAQQGGGAS